MIFFAGRFFTYYNVGKIDKGVLPSAKIIAGVGSKPLGKTPSKSYIAQNLGNVNKCWFSLSDDTANQLTDAERAGSGMQLTPEKEF